MIDMGLLGFYSRSALGKMKIKHFVVTEEISWNTGVDLWCVTSRLYHIPMVPDTSMWLLVCVDSSQVIYWLFYVPKVAF